jgi:hypothetical protein
MLGDEEEPRKMRMGREKGKENVGKPEKGEDHPHERVLRLFDPRAVQCVSLGFGYETDSVQVGTKRAEILSPDGSRLTCSDTVGLSTNVEGPR